MPKAKTLADLNRIYAQAEEIDKELFAEMRSNLLLVSGEHYSKVNARVASQIRQANKTPLAQEQKLRLTKNHMHKVHRSYVAAILAEAPGTTITPARDLELQDQKEAELNESVWQSVKYRHKLKSRIQDWCRDFVGVGEVCLKVFWDPNAGEHIGFEPQVHEETGEPIMEPTGNHVHDGTFDENGQPNMQPEMQHVPDEEKPLFQGDWVFEDVYGFNLLREAGTQNMEADHHRAWIVRKMVDVEELKWRYRHDADLVAKIHESHNDTFIVFDANKGSYQKAQGQTLMREFYYEPCSDYPNGYFFYAVKDAILEEGELPFGIFPLVWQGFDKHASTARGRSILKQARPYQAEINRASSSMAVAQVTLGDDKVLYQAGAKLSPGALLPGVRGIAYQGMAPTVLPGRSGAQYLEYVAAQIEELYDVVQVPQDDVDTSGQLDPYVLLFRSATQRKKYSIYIDKFDMFLCALTELVLKIGRVYLPDNMLIAAVGRREQINIAEFRKTSPLNYSVHVEPESETIETLLGKQLTFQHILQYVGNKLDDKTIALVAKNMPYGNWEDSFDDLTIDVEIVKNDMLALERGEQVQAIPQVDPAYMMKRLAGRMKRPDFKFLPPPVQQAYAALNKQYEQIAAQQAQALKAAQNEFIPVDGTLVTCDFYVPPKNPQEQAKRAKVPQRALEWLMQRLQEQGMTMDKLEGMNAQNLADLAKTMMEQRGQAPGGGQLPPGVNAGAPMPLHLPAGGNQPVGGMMHGG